MVASLNVIRIDLAPEQAGSRGLKAVHSDNAPWIKRTAFSKRLPEFNGLRNALELSR